MVEKRNMSEDQETSERVAAEVITGEELEELTEDDYIIRLKKPYKFEGKEYTEIDLSGLEDISAEDMIRVNKRLSRTSPGIDVLPEVSLEYAINLAAHATKLPIEFFKGLPGKYAIRIKTRVTGFLFGGE